jgi:hypothetical protein
MLDGSGRVHGHGALAAPHQPISAFVAGQPRAPALTLDQRVHPHMLPAFLREPSPRVLGRAARRPGAPGPRRHRHHYTHLDFQHLAKVYDATPPRAGRIRGPSDAKPDGMARSGGGPTCRHWASAIGPRASRNTWELRGLR